ncbi:hypothetical protein Mtc_1061 [Methanocella conradii HZ254]|uniref:Bacterial Ig-like domain (Group 1) n=2 Tax=Methanocella TaxID=570266 RepID=H8I6Y7_METCZ|nr:hypothetical protein Mtc_1061 [Methanocella conradii HZ254]
MLPIVPDGIAYVEGNDTLTAGTPHNVSVQILYRGGPLKSEGVRVYMLSNDTSIIPADIGTYVFTDKDGIASYTVIANKAGAVKLTAVAMSANSGVSADKAFFVVAPPVVTPTPTPIPAVNETVTPAPPSASPTAVITPGTTAKPPEGGSSAQAIGIIVAGVVIAIILLIMAFILRPLIKK